MSRAKEIFERLAKYAEENPELRTGQILHNVGLDVKSVHFKGTNKNDLFNLDDKIAVRMLNSFIIDDIAVDPEEDYLEIMKRRRRKLKSKLINVHELDIYTLSLVFEDEETSELFRMEIDTDDRMDYVIDQNKCALRLKFKTKDFIIPIPKKATYRNVTLKLAFNEIKFTELK